TLERWLEPIANYFIGRASNGPTEGFNRGLRGILWRACGMFNFRERPAKGTRFGGTRRPA
ncbi:MAG: transposase, partial [Alphaproteobacteria bacterium]